MIPRFKVGDLVSYYPVDVVYNEAIVSEERTQAIITGFYEDSYGEEEGDIVANYMPTFIATQAIKP